jgi:hypothetical protein
VAFLVEDRHLEEGPEKMTPRVPATQPEEAAGRRVAVGRAVQEGMVKTRDLCPRTASTSSLTKP